LFWNRARVAHIIQATNPPATNRNHPGSVRSPDVANPIISDVSISESKENKCVRCHGDADEFKPRLIPNDEQFVNTKQVATEHPIIDMILGKSVNDFPEQGYVKVYRYHPQKTVHVHLFVRQWQVPKYVTPNSIGKRISNGSDKPYE
jgi:hypothetical protein